MLAAFIDVAPLDLVLRGVESLKSALQNIVDFFKPIKGLLQSFKLVNTLNT